MSFLTNWKRCQKCGKMYITNRFDGELCGECEKAEQEPCDVFDKYGNYKYPSDIELTEPNTATSTPCTDSVSRQAVLEMAYDMSEIDGEHFTEPCMVVDVKDIEQMPSVIPTERTGHWVDDGRYEYFVCNQCKAEFERFSERKSFFIGILIAVSKLSSKSSSGKPLVSFPNKINTFSNFEKSTSEYTL